LNISIFKKQDKNKYRLIKSSALNKKNRTLVQLAKQFDSYGYISVSVGREIESLFDDQAYIVGIHRTGYSEVNEEYLQEVFHNGLINNMDLLQGAIHVDENYLDIRKTVDLFYDPIVMNGPLKGASHYKESSGCIIVKIPKSYLGIEAGEVKPIYYKDGVSVKLLPEYIYGYIPVDKNGVLGDIVNNPNYCDVHTYIDSEEVLLYETKALNRQRRK